MTNKKKDDSKDTRKDTPRENPSENLATPNARAGEGAPYASQMSEEDIKKLQERGPDYGAQESEDIRGTANNPGPHFDKDKDKKSKKK